MWQQIREEFKHNRGYWCLIFFIILIGLALRWYGLDHRAVHHDESLHGVYGYYWFDNAKTGHYKYNAMLHGPFLYYLLPFFYKIFGVSTFSMRALICSVGSLFILVPFLFRKYLTKDALFLAIASVSCSPLLVYYSRFIRHDFLVILGMILMVYAIILAKDHLKFTLFSTGLALNMATKENSFITICLILGILAYDLLFSLITKQQESLVKIIASQFKKNLIINSLGVLFAIFVYCYLMSAEFKHLPGILDGLYRKSLFYWFNQHNEQRINGPFSFQSLVLFWYEFPFVIYTIYRIRILISQSSHNIKRSSYLLMAISFTIYLLVKIKGLPTDPVTQFFKLNLPIDYLILILSIFLPIILTTHFYLKGERVRGILIYFFLATWFTYSYAGEKVPWLSLYPYIFGLFYFFFEGRKLNFTKKIYAIVIISLLFQTYQTMMTSHIRSGASSEILSQVHTSEKIDAILKSINKNYTTNLEAKTFGSPIVNWPISWYQVGQKRYYFEKHNFKVKNDYDYIFLKTRDHELTRLLNYKEERIPLRHWFSPVYSQMTLWNSLTYTLIKKTWSPVGSQDVWFYKR